MSKKSCFRGRYHKQHGKRVRARVTSASHGLYHVHRSLSSQLSLKKSLFFTCQILGLLVNTSAADDKYPVPNRDNLTIAIQMELSNKSNTFSQFFAAFLTCRLNFELFLKKILPSDLLYFRNCLLWTRGGKRLKSPVSENPSTSNIIIVHMHGSNLHHIVFIIFIDHCQVNWVGKSLSFWHAKSWDCLLTHWPPMKSILFLIETI